MSGPSSCGCKLEGKELEERLAAWREIATRATSSEMHPGRVTSIYPSEPEIVERLNELIGAEGECCSFLAFTVTKIPAGTVVEMSWPPDAGELVEAFLSRVHPGLDPDRSLSHQV